MKAILFLSCLLAVGCASNRPVASNAPVDGAEYYQLGQSARTASSRLYPDPHGGLGHSQDPDIRVTDIRLTASYTVVYMTFAKDPNNRDGSYFGTSSISFNPKAKLASSDGRKTYALLKADGIPMTPDSREIKNDDHVSFVLYFERLDEGVENFDLFECQSDNQNSCFNVAGLAVENPAR
ncbi:hypothetical protein [Spirosoma rhododendri]|uniref:Lipoprotein n=1 Tax=Spirosoma rhododendri TaxID=2728024 RepID=A0A7L5DGI3_9BACT|nr:hypothetical protein [Spirosoma rhododendri]QJD77354.1 hypothetical protein HH216_02150 [Spirosoma rhododendri]